MSIEAREGQPKGPEYKFKLTRIIRELVKESHKTKRQRDAELMHVEQMSADGYLQELVQGGYPNTLAVLILRKHPIVQDFTNGELRIFMYEALSHAIVRDEVNMRAESLQGSLSENTEEFKERLRLRTIRNAELREAVTQTIYPGPKS